MATTKQKAIAVERLYWKCHKIGDQVDVYNVMWDYKTIWQNASDEEKDAIYEYIVCRMGLKNYTDDVKAAENFLIETGWLKWEEIEEFETNDFNEYAKERLDIDLHLNELVDGKADHSTSEKLWDYFYKLSKNGFLSYPAEDAINFLILDYLDEKKKEETAGSVPAQEEKTAPYYAKITDHTGEQLAGWNVASMFEAKCELERIFAYPEKLSIELIDKSTGERIG